MLYSLTTPSNHQPRLEYIDFAKLKGICEKNDDDATIIIQLSHICYWSDGICQGGFSTAKYPTYCQSSSALK